MVALLVKVHLWIDHHLGNAVMVTQIEKDNATMVTNTVNPARKTNGLPDMVFAANALNGVVGQPCVVHCICIWAKDCSVSSQDA